MTTNKKGKATWNTTDTGVFAEHSPKNETPELTEPCDLKWVELTFRKLTELHQQKI